MSRAEGQLSLRLLPLVAAVIVLIAWFHHVEQGGPWVWRNSLPPCIVVLLSAGVLIRGGGRWTGRGWREPLAVAGFAVPAIGLSSYLHYAFAVNLDDMFPSGAGQLFRFLPIYTIGAGTIGAAIGWIAGRNVT